MKHYNHIYILLFFSFSLFSMETSSERKKRQQQTQDTTIQITPSSSGSHPVAAITSGGLTSSRKAAPKDLKEVRQLVRARSVHPDEMQKKRVVPPFGQGLEEIHQEQQQEIRQRKPNKQKTFTYDQVTQMVAEKRKRLSLITYTEGEVAEILGKMDNFDQQVSYAHPQITSRMHELGKKYNVPLEQLPAYTELLHGTEISPRLVADWVYKHYGTGADPHETIVAEYEKIAQKKPDKFQEVVFTMMQAFVDEMEAVQPDGVPVVPAVVADLHVDVLERRIEDQGTTIKTQGTQIERRDDIIYKERIVLCVKFLVLLGTIAWGFYGQFKGSCPAVANVTG